MGKRARSLWAAVKEFCGCPAVQGGMAFWLLADVWDGISTFMNVRFFPLVIEMNPYMWGATRGLPDFRNFLVVKGLFAVAGLGATLCMYKANKEWAWLPSFLFSWGTFNAAIGNTLMFWRMHG